MVCMRCRRVDIATEGTMSPWGPDEMLLLLKLRGVKAGEFCYHNMNLLEL